MASNPQIAALPAVRKLAEEWADDLIQALPIIQDGPITSDFARVIVEQLSDLSRDASFAAMVRLVAARTYANRGGKGGYIFGFGPDGWGILYDNEGHWCTFDEIPGLHGVDGPTNEVDALAIVALHVLGATHG